MSAGKLQRSFFDTNVLVYTDDAANPVKRRHALDLIAAHRRQGTGVVSLLVLQEYFVAVRRKFKLDGELARLKVEAFARFRLVEPRIADVMAAIDFHRFYQVSYWDALVIRMAKQGGCSVLLTEDMNDGQVIDGVRIVNPFV
ncbi:MAG TPA: PIN domain-containing protein [Terracidiphilus sp.]|nr:PIN domain-containing protein [Terracidiphilus sp.]